MGNKNTGKVGAIIGGGGIAALVLWAAIAVLVGFLTDAKGFSVLAALISGFRDYRVWLLWVAAAGAVAVTLVVRNSYSTKRVLSANKGEDVHWLSDAEIRKADNLTLTSYSRLAEVKDGVPIYAKVQGRDITIVLAKPIHTLVIGTTGSGKTSGYVDPVVQILCRTKTKPGLVITDPKGELYRTHAATLKAQGYYTLVIDLSDPYHSARWNPFWDIILKTRRLSAKVEQLQGKYLFDGKTYLTYDAAETERKVYVQQLTDEIFIDLQDVVYTLCPIESAQEPTWQKGARDLILALCMGMWEDLSGGMLEEKEFNLFTVYKNVTDFAKGECDVIKEYLAGRDKFSKAPALGNSVLVSTDRTLSSYLSEVNQYMTWLADSGVCAMTAENDVELSAFDETPTALFLKIPDEKENRHRLVTLMITQLYKILVYKARENQSSGATRDAELKRAVYMIMDEFGNMPKFTSIDKIITVGRSRRIFMIPIVQDYNQLDNKYGKELAAIVRSNCNIKVFIGSTDKNTINDFSELCGKTKQRHVSFSDQSSDKMNVSTSAESKPLIYPSELEVLNDPPQRMGNAIVLAYGKNPLRATYTPVFKAREIYAPAEGVPEASRAAEVFDGDAHYYSFLARNEYLRSAESMQAEQERIKEMLLAGGEEPRDENSDALCVQCYAALSGRIKTLESFMPAELYIELTDACGRHDLAAVAALSDSVTDYALERRDNFTAIDAAKLKVFAQSIQSREEKNNEENA